LHLFERQWIAFPKQVENAVASLAKARRNVTPAFMLLLYVTIVGPSGLMRQGRQLTAFADSWFESVTKLPMSSAISYVILAFKGMIEVDLANKISTAKENLSYFAQNWAKRPILKGDWVTGVFSIPLLLVSPGFWVYLTTLWKGWNPDFSYSLNMYGLLHPEHAETPGAVLFDLLGITDLASIDWTNRPVVKAQLGLSVDLMKEVERLISIDLQANPSLSLSTEVITPKPDPVWDWLDDPATKTPLWEALVGRHLTEVAVGRRSSTR
jgi:hypothetical protein